MKLENERKRKKNNAKIREELKTHSDWQKDLQPIVNHIARLIDHNHSCISCNGNGKPQGGHYHSTGANSSLRFNLHNIHLQDYRCNCMEGANITGYNLGLIDRYGKDYQEYVEYQLVRDYPIIKLSIPELKIYRERAREIVKLLKKQNFIYPAKKRMELRTKFNQAIGIYIHNKI